MVRRYQSWTDEVEERQRGWEAELGGWRFWHLGRIGAAVHRKPAVNSGHYRIVNA
jgi:hypothetical protein